MGCIQPSKVGRKMPDPDALTVELARVVDETVQPDRITLWLKEPGGKTP